MRAIPIVPDAGRACNGPHRKHERNGALRLANGHQDNDHGLLTGDTMWFKRKPRNRRLGREYVLDVKLRSSQVRAARARMAAIALGALFALVLGLYLIWRGGEWALNRLIYQNKAFAIEQIDIQTDGVIALNQLRRWAGVQPGQNLLALDLARVQRDLLMVSLIQSASIERVLPRTLRIRITEREPLAQITLPQPHPGGGIDGVPYYLDAEGYVILPLDPAQRNGTATQPGEPLPLLSGPNANQFQVGRRVEAPQVQAALQLLVAFDHSSMAGLVDIKKIDVSASEVLVVTTGQGSEVTFGRTGPDQQLRRWHEIYEMGQRMSKAIATLDLAVTNNIPARWLEASAVPTGTPKPPKQLRKKHV
ncbi:MAG TPA: FtsQ-type POTRA domain-containing protein [Candidatus Binatia bacterium]|nr:FtsQ-type POTRA domain-containing protein [Candidatus Binatia bacterium]